MFEKCLYFNASSLSRTIDRLWIQAFEKFKLTPPQAFLLRLVLSSPGLTVSDLAKLMNVAKPTATRAMNHLESAGYLNRLTSKDDGRESLITPTKKALRIQDDLNLSSGLVTKKLKTFLGEERFFNFVSDIREIDYHIQSNISE